MAESQRQGKRVQRDFARELGLPEGATVVNSRVWFQDRGNLRAVFVEQTSFYSYSLQEKVEHHFCAAQLVEAGLATSKAVCEAFAIKPRTFSRVRRQLRTGGISALVPEARGPKSRRSETNSSAPVIVRLYQTGQSVSKIASQVGLSPSTIRRVLKDHGIKSSPRHDRDQRTLLVEESGLEQAETVEQEQEESVAPLTDMEPIPDSLCEVAAEECSSAEENSDKVATAVESGSVPRTVSETRGEFSDDCQAEPAVLEGEVGQAGFSPVEATSIPYASPLGRFCAIFGLIEEAPVQFQSTSHVVHAGVLLGLALLEDTHLLTEARAVYGSLKHGWYGLRSLIWTLMVMALLRIKRPEQIKNHDPASLGFVLGLPRAAEVKTIRRKLGEIGELRRAAELHRRLAKRRAESDPNRLATLYVDGHVRVYHGRHRLGKMYASRVKKIVRGETDYWVHTADGEPLLVIHDPLNEAFTETLLRQVLPAIRPLIGQRRVRIVFDREGWSRELFHGLIEAGLDFMTYRKGSYEPLAESRFATVTYEREGEDVSCELAEDAFQSEGWPTLRLIAVKKKNGGQTHVVATGRSTWEEQGKSAEELADYVDPPAFDLAYSMFGRWRQENWFKYMMEEYALDVLVDYEVEPDDPDRLVPNPQWRRLDQQVKKTRQQHQRESGIYTSLMLRQEAASESSDCGNQCGSCLGCKQRAQLAVVQRSEKELQQLRKQRRATPKEVRLGDVDDRDPVKLSYDRKLFTDTVKLCAYEIETRLYGMLAGIFGRREFEGRSLIRDLLSTPGDLRVQGNVLEVHLEQRSTPRYTQALQSLCARVNALNPRLPETTTALRFYVKPRPVGE